MQLEHVEWLINCVQVFISPLVAAIVHNNYHQVALGFYLRKYIRMLSKSQVSESLHIVQFPHHTRRQLRYYL